MDKDITINTRTFVGNYDDKTGSKRTCISRGAMLPDVLEVRHQAYTDSATKLPGRRSMVKLSRSIQGEDNTVKVISLHMVCARPNDPAVTVPELQALVNDLIALFTPTANGGLNQAAHIFGSEGQ